jgi:hypothetical protein
MLESYMMKHSCGKMIDFNHIITLWSPQMWEYAERAGLTHNRKGDFDECPGFTATREELLILAKYWAEFELGRWQRAVWTGSISGSESAEFGFARKRINRIAKALGNNRLVQVVVDDVWETHRKVEDPLVWRILVGKATAKDKKEFDRMQEEYMTGERSPKHTRQRSHRRRGGARRRPSRKSSASASSSKP